MNMPWWGMLPLRVRPSYCHAHCTTERTNARPREGRKGSHCFPNSWAAHHDCLELASPPALLRPVCFPRVKDCDGSTLHANTSEPASGSWMPAKDRRFLGQRTRAITYSASGSARFVFRSFVPPQALSS